jgi:Tol biopolymer transport system component
MGEVYRGRDTKLGRDVAIKVLPPAFASHADRLDRFEQEARAAGMLNHPNLLSVYELGVHDGAPYIVTELLEGETLRERMQNADGSASVAIAPRKAIDYAVQIANGLAAAHGKGVVHRDLKPENIFITRDGRVKILDFGLAKLANAPDDGATDQHTMKRNTAPGTVMGTAGYMSPEQVRGQTLDSRSDIFSFGAILYEMLSGRRAFHGDSSVETMNAVLKEDPPDLSSVTSAIPPALQRIVDHCLEKNPEARFQSSRDLAFDLGAISSMSDTGALTPRRRIAVGKWLPIAVALALVAAAAAYFATRSAKIEQPKLHQLSFRRGTLRAARFAPDGQSIIYSAAWDGGPLLLYQTRANALDSVALQLPPADLLAMSPGGDMAIGLDRVPRPWAGYGTLAQASMLGAASRQLLENVSAAEWTPDGSQMIVVHNVNRQDQIEWPMGKPIHRATGYIDHLRISRDGKTLAFLNHPQYNDNRGDVAVIDAAGNMRTLVKDWAGLEGLAWSADGKEIWFTGDPDGTVGNFEIYGVDMAGHVRAVWQVPTSVYLLDVARDGRVLVASGVIGGPVYAMREGDAGQRDLAWLAWSSPAGLSDDGKLALLVSFGAGAGRYYSTSVRPTDGASGTRLSEGLALSLSHDNKWALSLKMTQPPQLLVTPTGAGESHVIDSKGIAGVGAEFLPDNRLLIVAAHDSEREDLWIVDWQHGSPAQKLNVTIPAGSRYRALSPDGKWVAVPTGTEIQVVYLDGSAARHFDTTKTHDILARAADAQSIYVAQYAPNVYHVDRIDIATGRRTKVRDVPVGDLTGATGRGTSLFLSADAKTYVTGFTRWLTDLYVVEGLK